MTRMKQRADRHTEARHRQGAAAGAPPIPKPPPRYFKADGGAVNGRSPAAGSVRRAAAQPLMHRADLEPRRLPAPLTDVDDGRNVVVCVSPSGGVGLSVTAALLALAMTSRGSRCALVDADCAHGGLDVLLGLERERGMRMSDVEAPLGRLEGDALLQELPRWRDVHVLGADPWNGEAGQWWEVQAAVSALAQVRDVVVVDAGRGEAVGQVNALARAPMLMLVELTVLGLARARAMTAAMVRIRGGDAPAPWLLGMHPRGVPVRSGRIGAAQASTYLGETLVGTLKPRRSLCGSVVDGLGVVAVPGAYRRTFDALGALVEKAGGHGGA